MITITTAYVLSMLVFSVSGFCDMSATGAIPPSEADNIPMGQCEFYIDLHGWPYYLTNPNNCSQFWECATNGDICLFECAHCDFGGCDMTGALYFNPDILYPDGPACDWPSAIECHNPWETTSPPPPTTTTPACDLPCQNYVNGKCQPECCEDPDCSTGMVCNSNGNCELGCRNHTECEGWNAECPSCMWCDTHNGNIDIGTCVPGCLTNEQCGTNEKCMDHECIGCDLPCQTMDDNGVCAPECCSDDDCTGGTPFCNTNGICVAGCLTTADCDGANLECHQPWAVGTDNCEYCGNPVDGIGSCLPGCDQKLNQCPADYPLCDGSNHHCNSDGIQVLKKIQLTTGACDGCNTNDEGGAIISLWGKTACNCNCTTGSLDKPNWVDYEPSQVSVFESGIDTDQMSQCDNARMRPDTATITWTGEGTWTPTEVILVVSGDYKYNCIIPDTGLATGESWFNIKCED